MKKTNSQKTRLGLFVIIGTLLFVTGVYLIGQRQNMFRKTYTISAYFQNVNGLQKGNNVRYSGINIGTVKAIEMTNDSTVKVLMSIEEKIMKYLKTTAVATIGSDGLVGNMIINIVPGEGDAVLIQDGDVIKSFSKVGPDDILSNLSVTIQNTETLTNDLLKITSAINEGDGILAILLNDSLMAAGLKNSMRSIQRTSQFAANTMDEIGTLVEQLQTDDTSVMGLLLNDTISATTLKRTLTNLEEASGTMNNALQTINTFVSEVNTNPSALNYILKDSAAVRSLQSTLEHINEGTDKFNQNMEALKHNFLTRGYFKKLERQAAKAKKNN